MKVKYPTPSVLPAPVKPFASINVEKDDSNNEIKVIAQVSLTRDYLPEGAAFGLALDGSKSMRSLYGGVGDIWDSPNVVKPVAKTMLKFLGECSETVDFLYWAVGPGGKETEEIGSVALNQVDSLTIRPKKSMGSGTHLLPVTKHFVEGKLQDAPWAMAIIVTDGRIDDEKDLLNYTEQYAVSIDAGKQKLVKLVLIGLGEYVDVEQLDRIDSFETSVGVDVWSSKLASDMEDLNEIFDEVMGDIEIAPSGKILDNTGRELKAYNDGLKARMEFQLKPGSTRFKLEIPGRPPIEQDLSEALNLLK